MYLCGDLAKRKPSKNCFQLDKIEMKIESHDKQLNSINVEMAMVRTDVGWLKGEFKKLDYRVWAILAGTVISILVVIFKG